MKKLAFASAVLVPLFASPVFAEDAREIVGRVDYIIDGDTIAIGDENVRIWGIDAPERDQHCREMNGLAYACGIEAKNNLHKIISGRVVTCHQRGFNPQKGKRRARVVAQCFVDVDRSDIGRAMVMSGYAFRTGHAGDLYADVQRFAFKTELGLWRGSFQEPWHWREANAE